MQVMSNLTITVSKEQLVDLLVQLPFGEIKGILDSLIERKMFPPPNLEEIAKEAERIVKKEKLEVGVIEEAKRWARSRK